MASARTFQVGPRALLAGDGGLLTAATVGIGVGLYALGVGWLSPLGMVALLLTPPLAWYLHGRHVDATATLGAVLGGIVGAVVAFLAVNGLGSLFGMSQTNLPGPVVAVVVAAYLAVAAWLAVDALRDLSPQRRTHVRLDIVRLLATVAYVAFVVGWIVWARGLSPDVDRVQALALLYEPGAMGAAAVTGADLLARRHERRSHGHLVSGA